MAQSKSRMPPQKLHSVQQPIPAAQDELSDHFKGLDSDDPTEKDETEVELEKLVFGDDAGFHEGLKSYNDNAFPSKLESNAEDQQNAAQVSVEEQDLQGVDDADLFFFDSAPLANLDTGLVLAQTSEDDGQDASHYQQAAAWIDSEDERIVVSLASNPRLRKLRLTESEDLVNGKEYTKRLRRQFERLYPVPEWANPAAVPKASPRKRRRTSGSTNSSDEDVSADDMSINHDDLSAQPLAKLLQSSTGFIQPTGSSARKKLRPEVIDIQRTKDVSGVQPSAITSLAFHPSYPLLLTSGPSSTLYLHHVSPHPPQPNPLLTSLHIRRNPLTTSVFLPPQGNKIFFSGRRRYFHVWDLQTGKIEKVSRVYGHQDEQKSMERSKLSPCGRWMGLVGSGRKGGGLINVLDAGTRQWVAEVRVEGKGGVADLAWWGDGNGMVIIGKGGEAVEWDGRKKIVVGRWVDEGAVGTTVVALGGKGTGAHTLGADRWIAVGSSSGIVNIYDRRSWDSSIPAAPKPVRAFDHLTTPTSHLEFSPDGQVMVMASRWKRDALRLVHLPSCTVYRNWPTSSTPLGTITAVAFAPNSEMLAVANEQGKIRLWEIRS